MAHKVTDECVACGACVDTCPVGAITMEDKAVVDAASCVDCGACEGACPTGAITFEEREAPAYDEAAVQENKKKKELQEKMERLAELNSLLNMDEKEMPQDQEKEVDQVADLSRRSVNYAGRVSEGRKGKIEKSSVLGRLKTTQRNMEKGWKNRNMQKKKPEQQL